MPKRTKRRNGKEIRCNRTTWRKDKVEGWERTNGR